MMIFVTFERKNELENIISHDTDGDGNIDTTPRTISTGHTSGFLEVGRDLAITISFEFTDGVVLIESVSVS